MLEFICYFMPSFISVNIHKKLTKNNNILDMIIYYGIYLSINNFLSLVIKNIKHLSEVLNLSVINLTYLYKYLFVSIIVSLITPYILNIINKNIELRFKVKKSEEANK